MTTEKTKSTIANVGLWAIFLGLIFCGFLLSQFARRVGFSHPENQILIFSYWGFGLALIIGGAGVIYLFNWARHLILACFSLCFLWCLSSLIIIILGAIFDTTLMRAKFFIVLFYWGIMCLPPFILSFYGISNLLKKEVKELFCPSLNIEKNFFSKISKNIWIILVCLSFISPVLVMRNQTHQKKSFEMHRTFFLQGDGFLKQGKYKEAASEYEKSLDVIKRFKGFTDFPYKNMAAAYFELGEYQKAQDCFFSDPQSTGDVKAKERHPELYRIEASQKVDRYFFSQIGQMYEPARIKNALEYIKLSVEKNPVWIYSSENLIEFLEKNCSDVIKKVEGAHETISFWSGLLEFKRQYRPDGMIDESIYSKGVLFDRRIHKKNPKKEM